MNDTQNKVLSEVRQIPNLTTDRPKSFVVFNISKGEQKELFELIENEFSTIKKSLKKLRDEELRKMLNDDHWITDKYSNLLDRYENTELNNYVMSIADEGLREHYKSISEQETDIKTLLDELELKNFDIINYNEKMAIFDRLSEELDFSNLRRYNEDKRFAQNYKLTEDEKEYNEVWDYRLKFMFLKYLFCGNTDYHEDFDKLFRSQFKWDHLKWSIFCFEISRENFEQQATDFAKHEMFLNREIIE